MKEDTVSLGGSLDFAGSDHAVTAYTDVLDESTGYDETAIYDTVPAYASSHEEHNDSQINVYESDEESETNSHDDRAGVYMRENSEYNGVVTSGLPVSLDEAYHMTASPDYSHLTPVHSPANLSTYAYVAVCPSSRPPKFPPVTEADGGEFKSYASISQDCTNVIIDLKAQNAILVQQLAHSNLYGNEKCLENIEQKREIAQKDAFIKQLQECNLMIAEENVKLAKQLGRRPTTMQMFGLVRQL